MYASIDSRWVALLLASVIGVLISGSLRLAKVIDRERPVAIGPYLAVGANEG